MKHHSGDNCIEKKQFKRTGSIWVDHTCDMWDSALVGLLF